MYKKIALFLILQYLITVFLLILLYKGGNYYNPDEAFFVFEKNYLSDLGRTAYFNGERNPLWWIYSITLALAGLGTFLFFFLMAKNLRVYQKSMVLFFALLAGLGLVGIAVFPVDIYLKPHIISGSIAFFSFFIALLFLLVFSVKTNTKMQNFLLFLFIFLFSVFLAIKFLAPSSRQSEQALMLKVIAQKIIVASQLLIPVLLLLLPVKEHEDNDVL